MDEWKSDPELCKQAAVALNNPIVRQLLDVLRTNHIGQWALSPAATMEERAMFAAKAEGYGLALNDFESLAEYQEPVQQLEATFGVEEEAKA